MKPPAYKLPHLLSILPRDGRAALVRRTQWPENSFYKVARTNIKFRPNEAGELKPFGKAWGQLFWRGKPIIDRKITPRIKGALKHRWVTVERSALPEETHELIAQADVGVAKALAEREERLQAKRAAKKERLAAEKA